MTGWAVSLPPDAAHSAAGLRLELGIEVLELPDALWLRGAESGQELEKSLARLPGARRYHLLPDGQLRPLGSRLPRGRLPSGNWQKIRAWAAVELPVAALAGRYPEPVSLRIVRTTLEAEANVLLTSLGAWKAYGSGAPLVRLDRLRFAVAAEGWVVVHGTPLPPLEGERFCECSGVALLCGWGWSPAVEPEVIARSCKLGREDLALIRPDGQWEHVRGEQFVRASRSAIRVSSENEPSLGIA